MLVSPPIESLICPINTSLNDYFVENPLQPPHLKPTFLHRRWVCWHARWKGRPTCSTVVGAVCGPVREARWGGKGARAHWRDAT